MFILVPEYGLEISVTSQAYTKYTYTQTHRSNHMTHLLSLREKCWLTFLDTASNIYIRVVYLLAIYCMFIGYFLIFSTWVMASYSGRWGFSSSLYTVPMHFNFLILSAHLVKSVLGLDC